MNLWTNVGLALKALNSNKTRSFLTLLGIVIGIGAVISVMSIGKGAQAAITSQIEGIGTNLIFVRPGQAVQQGVRQGEGTAATLTLDDAEALADFQLAPAVQAVAPEVQSFGQVVFSNINTRARLLGVTPAYADVRGYTVAEGEFIDDQQVQGRSLVAVLGANIAQTLFPDMDPIGQSLRINQRPFRVVGVLERLGGTGFGTQDDTVVIPITTMLSRLQVSRTSQGARNVQLVNVQAADADLLPAAKEQISAILRERHRIDPGGVDDFNLTTQDDLVAARTQVANTLTVFLGAIAAVSLLVGGIGIMNIMLVSVAERTREIGIRKAVGAKRRHILSQFLVEAVVLSALGGCLGVALGWGLARGVSHITLSGQRLPSVVSPDIVVLAVGVSLAIGLFFGIYPASRASRLDPIEALRRE